MAYSTNQNQLRKHGRGLLETTETGASQPIQSIALWSRLNLLTADYGESILRTQYLRIRFEDLCHQPVSVINQIFAFFGLAGDVEHIAQLEVRPPDSLGRWRTQGRDTLAEIHRVGHVALERFGYHRAEITKSAPRKRSLMTCITRGGLASLRKLWSLGW
jgi:hypothetical protein